MPRTRTLLIAAIAVAATFGLTGTSLTTAGAAPATDHARTAHPNATAFAMKGWGFGSAATGGDVPTNSAPSAWEVIGCTNRAGLAKTNNVNSATVPSLGTADNVTTRIWTTRSGSVVSSWASNTVGQITLSDSPLGSLVLTAVSTTARAYHDGSKFRTATNTDVAKLVFKPAVGPAQTYSVPAPNRPVEIPGFATVTVAQSASRQSATGAQAGANGLKVELHASHSTVRVAHAVAQISRGVKAGLFSGQSYGVSGKAGGDVVNLGRNPLIEMPCVGTGGRTPSRTLSHSDLGGQAVAGATHVSQMAQQTKSRAWGWERSQVTSIDLGGGVKVNGIFGQVNVSRQGPHLSKLVTSIAGTRIGNVVVNGQTRDLPISQTMEIPGVAKLQPAIVTKLPNGLQVVALRITLLDGSGAVIDLGTSKLQVRKPAR